MLTLLQRFKKNLIILSTHYQPALAIVCPAIPECSRIDLFFLSPKTTASLHVSLKERKSQLITGNSIYYSDAIISAMASQITSLTVVYSTVYLSADQRKHQSSASLAFMRGIHRWSVNSSHKGPVTRKMFPFDDLIMICSQCWYLPTVITVHLLLSLHDCCTNIVLLSQIYHFRVRRNNLSS